MVKVSYINPERGAADAGNNVHPDRLGWRHASSVEPVIPSPSLWVLHSLRLGGAEQTSTLSLCATASKKFRSFGYIFVLL